MSLQTRQMASSGVRNNDNTTLHICCQNIYAFLYLLRSAEIKNNEQLVDRYALFLPSGSYILWPHDRRPSCLVAREGGTHCFPKFIILQIQWIDGNIRDSVAPFVTWFYHHVVCLGCHDLPAVFCSLLVLCFG